jgi:hypothetical protein
VFFGDSQDIYGSGFKTARIPLLAAGRPREPTFYNRYGDLFGWSCVAIALVSSLGVTARDHLAKSHNRSRVKGKLTEP